MVENNKNDSDLSRQVTLVVPAYNHADYVEECLESIALQDYPRLEVIIINDGSTDATEEKIQGFLDSQAAAGEAAQQAVRFKYISKQNEGLIRALNTGLALAGGKYFCELASDDVLLPGSISARVEFMESHPGLDFAFADCFIMEGARKTDTRLISKPGGKAGYDSSIHTVEDFINRAARIFFPTGIFKVAALRRLGSFDEDFRLCEDTFMRYKMALEGGVGFNDTPVMYYRHHGENVSRGDPLRIMPEKILALEKLLALVKERRLKALIKEKLFKYNMKYFSLGREEGLERDKLRQALEKAIECRPSSVKARYLRKRHG